MNVEDFDYELPENLIAQEPPPRRTDARMMVVDRAQGTFTHHHVADLPSFLNLGDLLVMNNTRVIPVRTFGYKKESGGAVEILFLEPAGDNQWFALCGSNRSPAEGARLILANGELEVEVLELLGEGKLRLRILDNKDLVDLLDEYGHMPLPPYIKRQPSRSNPNQQDDRVGLDKERYQTVYAEAPGAAAAPTAGLHFTPELLGELTSMGVPQAMVTLHVSLGTFRPVDVSSVEDHKMDPERYSLGVETADAIRTTQHSGGRVVCVGTTSAKTLETICAKHGEIVDADGASDLFIYPPFDFKAVDCMLTNFHLPKSTLLMMISAFAGKDLVMSAYEEAVRREYRFFSYGDCVLLI